MAFRWWLTITSNWPFGTLLQPFVPRVSVRVSNRTFHSDTTIWRPTSAPSCSTAWNSPVHFRYLTPVRQGKPTTTARTRPSPVTGKGDVEKDGRQKEEGTADLSSRAPLCLWAPTLAEGLPWASRGREKDSPREALRRPEEGGTGMRLPGEVRRRWPSGTVQDDDVRRRFRSVLSGSAGRRRSLSPLYW